MNIEIRNLVYLASLTRIVLFLIQIVANHLVNDHQADAFNPPKVGTSNYLIEFLFDGFRRWDSVHFLNIAQHGYVFEHSAAFFPLFPLSVNLFATKFLFALVDDSYSIYLLSASLLNFIYFNISLVYLYKLTCALFNNNKLMAFYTCLFYSFNPGNIFFSAAYSESLYAMLTLSALFYLYSDRFILSLVLFFMSALTRSNGFLNSGYLIYFIVRLYLVKSSFKLTFHLALIGLIFKAIFSILFVFSAFVSYQYYIYVRFCTSSFKNQQVPFTLINYAKENEYNLITTNASAIEWCSHSLPSSYSHIQSAYWNVGFLRYWQIKQIPNFLLASPLLFLSFLALSSFLSSFESKFLFNLFGLFSKEKNFKTFQQNFKVFPFAVHLVVLLISSLFFMHVQVATRFVCSSNPFIYWYAASILDKEFKIKDNNNKRLVDIKFINFKNGKLKFIAYYFILYSLFGTILFVNFYPFT